MANLDGVALQPFRMHANLYFVGSEKVSVHLLDTSEGLVLIDTGYPEMHDLILENIRAMGFAPEKLRAIFHTHGHIDHYGNTRELVALSGASGMGVSLGAFEVISNMFYPMLLLASSLVFIFLIPERKKKEEL